MNKKDYKENIFTQNISGFTLVEMLVTVGISSIAFLAAHNFFTTIDKQTKESSDNLEKVILDMHTDKILRMDFSKSKYSLNNLFFKDDNNKGFFDYLQDGICASTPCDRVYNLEIPTTENQYGNPFFLLIEDTKAGHDLLYNPADAYSSALPNSLSFVSLNRNEILKNRDKSPWKKEKLIYIYSPTPLRAPGDVEGKDPSRVLSYLGWVENGTGAEILQKESIENGSEKIYKPIDPRTSTLLVSEDDFLKKLPYTAGLGTYVIINAAKIIRYRMKTVKSQGVLVGQLLRGEKKIDGTYNERIIGFNIKKLSFYRDDISFPTIGINLESFSQLDIKHAK